MGTIKQQSNRRTYESEKNVSLPGTNNCKRQTQEETATQTSSSSIDDNIVKD